MTLIITTLDKKGNIVKNSDIKINTIVSKDRQGKIRLDSGFLNIEDLSNNHVFVGRHFSFKTNKNGVLKIKVSDPHGIGVQTTIDITADDHISRKIDLIFKVITSPDSNKAQMYGYMDDYVYLNAKTRFRRPFLEREYASDIVYHHANEDWGTLTYDNAVKYCNTMKYFIPIRSLLNDFSSQYPADILLNLHGWPIVSTFSGVWSSSEKWGQYPPRHLIWYLDYTNRIFYEGLHNSAYLVLCTNLYAGDGLEEFGS
ncbi:hypothetical protein GJT88_02305 (plasmid) [Enterobacteriaceae endosymbiont of Donacia tomentosa]|nr:hypothetical protein GJT88_02305 [Enterobacteriaceae endosymbiont of Donacia tomentosa]